MKKIESNGITLIALVITIVVLLLLAGVAISSFTGSGIFSKASEASFKTKMAAYKEETMQYVSWQISQTMNTDTTYINAGELLKDAINQEIVTDITTDDVTISINDILKDLNNNDKEYIVVYKGELCYVSNNSIKNNENQVRWCEDLGIQILEYSVPEGIEVKNGKYELVNGLYLCTPKLDQGFDTNKTRYLEVGSNGYLTPGNWITGKPTTNWYDYSQSKWANIYVENTGSDVYYVWIPRYCFKLDQTTQRSDVKFIDVDNNYQDADGNVTTWDQLQADGYQVPEAFKFDNNEISGYWAMKYTAGDITTPSIINYDMAVIQGIVNIKNITLNTSITNANPIVKYTVALNGKVIQEVTDVTTIGSKVIEFSNLKEGNNIVNITGLNANGEIVGSMTKEYAPAVVN